MQKVIALGFFDGVHLGHGALLRRTNALAAQYGAEPAVLTFDRNPGKNGKLLTSVADRSSLISELYGIDTVICLPFDEALRSTAWDSFIRTLVRQQEAVCLVCGWDYRFGSSGEGTPELLQSLCKELQIGCEVVDRTQLHGITVSSTYLRQLVAAGDMEQATEFYGHPHILSGEVVHGQQLGRQLGTPTANLFCGEDILLPQRGVYAVKALIEGREYAAVCNVGQRPTVSGTETVIEAWLPEQSFDLYGKTICLSFLRKLRNEQKFPSLDALREQILRDAEQAKAYFEDHT